MADHDIRSALTSGRCITNAWLMLGSPLIAEIVGADPRWEMITIDQQHGVGGNERLLASLTAARAARLPAFVRVARGDEGLIARALDAGAAGVICPMVNSPDEARSFVACCKYAPEGRRSYGPFRAQFLLDGDYFATANEKTIACAQIETKEAVENLEAILAVQGLDMVLVGPNDLAISLLGGRRDPGDRLVCEALSDILSACRRHDVIAAIYANDAVMARTYIAQGWQSVAIGADLAWLKAGASAILDEALG